MQCNAVQCRSRTPRAPRRYPGVWQSVVCAVQCPLRRDQLSQLHSQTRRWEARGQSRPPWYDILDTLATPRRYLPSTVSCRCRWPSTSTLPRGYLFGVDLGTDDMRQAHHQLNLDLEDDGFLHVPGLSSRFQTLSVGFFR